MNSYSTLLNLNFMASLRTDNIVMDMFLAALIPFLSSIVYKLVYKQWPAFLVFLMNAVLTSETKSDISSYCKYRMYDLDENALLREAVMQYVGSEVEPTCLMGSYKYKRIPSGGSTFYGLDELLRTQYKVLTVPSLGIPVKLPEKITISRLEDVIRSEKDGKETSTVVERVILDSSCSYFGKEDPSFAFVKKSFEWYKKKVFSMSNQRRYLYQPLDCKNGNGDETSSMVCQRYPLSEEKTFNTLFFKEKHKLLNLLDDFREKRGKFSIPGFPHKLVILLYGPPGTGKTSLVKAIAQHTKRNILAISLSRIHTNHQLISYMFDPSCNLDSSSSSSSVSVKLKTEKVVYMLEDIDAAGKTLVCKKPNCAPPPEIGGARKEEDSPSLLSAENEICPGVLDNQLLVQKKHIRNDQLSLSGLLDALNGILDSPNRIVVMTTNHLEHLDPSLTRPGVVTYKLHMSVFDEDTALDMVRHYFYDVDPQTEQKIADVIRGLRENNKRGYSPAEIEQLCAENGTAEDLLNALISGSRADIF